MEVGRRIKRYEIVEISKREAERTTGKCRDHLLGREWFVKFIPSEFSSNEFEHLMMLNHRRVPKVIDIVKDTCGTYFIMDCIKGMNLYEYIKHYKLTNQRLIRLIINLCQILEHVHCMNIIHGDIKPENLMFDEEDVHLVDFGSSFRGVDSNSFTLEYVAPERLLDTFMADERSDLYSVGVLMKQLCDYTTNHSIREWLSALKLKKCIKKCCQLNPSKRFQSVLDLKEFLLSKT